MKLIMIKGLPGSGKSTWAKTQTAKRVNKDDLRAMIDNGVWSKKNEEQILRIRDLIVDKFLSEGHDVIVDDTNLDPKHEQHLKIIAQKYDAQFIVQDFTGVPMETCIQQDLKRLNSVGEAVIRRMNDQFLRKYEPEACLNPVVYDPKLPYCVIFDIDGTLARINGRNPYDGKACANDLPNQSIINLNNMVYMDPDVDRIIIFSGRTDESKAETEAWLQKHNVQYNEIHMRKTGDSRKDSIVKEEMFNKYIKNKFNVQFVVDDRNSVVDQWRSMGVTCLQCARGDF